MVLIARAAWPITSYISLFLILLLLALEAINPLGAHSGEVTPGSIPNPAVKLPCAYDTGWATGRESRSAPRVKILLFTLFKPLR